MNTAEDCAIKLVFTVWFFGVLCGAALVTAMYAQVL